jgi:hypothetical protein
MRRLLCLVLLVALVAVGCSDTQVSESTSTQLGPARSALARRLALLCTRARLNIEALGLPAEKGIAVVAPTARIGRRLAAQIGALRGRTALERRRLQEISHDLDSYYIQLKAGIDAYRTAGSEGFQVAVEGAKPLLVRAETLATRFGAPECAKRAFDDYQPS